VTRFGLADVDGARAAVVTGRFRFGSITRNVTSRGVGVGVLNVGRKSTATHGYVSVRAEGLEPSSATRLWC
jgi:hypothetical protein